MKLEFSRQFYEEYSISNFIKILPVRAELFHANRRTDRHDASNSSFSQFCERA